MLLRRLSGFVFAFVLSITAFSLAAEARRVEIIISKVSQKMTVKVDGDTEYVWPVSTGAARYETPSGSFRPFRMEAEHFSKEWDDAPMPHSIFFTGEGHAIHGSYHVNSLGRKASHGCVRLAPENAAILFNLVQTAGMSNTRVVLKGGLFDFGGSRKSFAEVGDDIDKIVSRKPSRGFFWTWNNRPKVVKKDAKAKKVVVKKPAEKPKKVATASPKKVDAKTDKPAVKKAAEKCVEKAGKKVCTKPVAIKAASNS
jgi:L,D-transpeptidase catalytic domain